MPQIYPLMPRSEPPRRSRSYSASSASSSSSSSSYPQPRDADDTIVLSDLLRTGEASRLRRRGAMRIDHNALHPDGSRAPAAAERQNWDSDYEMDQVLVDGHFGRRYPRRRRSSRRYGPYTTAVPPRQEQQPDEYVYTLVCGAEVTSCDFDDTEPFKPSVLPLYPPSASSSSAAKQDVKRSTGCGAVIHVRAAPRPRVSVWAARSAATDAVVPLDACYFDTREAARFVRSSCGCVKEGVGCAMWCVIFVIFF
ncbi:hypothetical protein NLJ89_g11772 [Agrocybe chaxingu]|uniref:Uncharacterized protein n=1 Tax=Agrocybe chaxingu TaxID=84603 RepID=A0A9W8MP33_9AGAR|nr:hypothetical protein NLJ89_g11772 [Agrocybe chaxingu]